MHHIVPSSFYCDKTTGPSKFHCDKVEIPTKFQWNKIDFRRIFTHKRNRFGMTKHWRRKRKKVLIRKSLIPWRPEKKVIRTYKMPKERRVFKVGWGVGRNRKGGRMLRIRRQR